MKISDTKAGRSVAMLLSNPLSSPTDVQQMMEQGKKNFMPDPRIIKEGEALLKEGYRITVLAWDREATHTREESRNGIDIQRLQVKASYGRGLAQIPGALRFYLSVLRRLRRSQFDIVHCNDLETLPAGFLARLFLGKKVIFDAHEPNYFSDARRFRRLLMFLGHMTERLMVPRVNCVTVINAFQADKYRRMGAKDVKVVPNYPDEALINSILPRDNKEHITIGRIGALVYDTGVEELIDAFQILRRKYPNLRLLIAGGGWDREYIDALARRVNSLEGGTLIAGYDYSDLPKLYRDIDVCAMPYHRTPWFRNITPVKFFEALCFGVPVITTDIGGIGQVVREEECGILLEEVTPETVSQAVETLVLNPDRRRAAGERGRKAIMERYNWGVSLDSLLAAYRKVEGQ